MKRIKYKWSRTMAFLAVRNADQRIKKKKIEWDPKAKPVLTWRWRLEKAPAEADPIAVIYVAFDTDLHVYSRLYEIHLERYESRKAPYGRWDVQRF